MRLIFLFSALFILLGSCGTAADCSVKVNIFADDLPLNELYRMNAFLVSEDDNRERPIDFRKELSIEVDGLKPSRYKIIFMNKYEELIVERFTLREGEKSVTVNLNYSQIDPKAYLTERRIDKLKNGDRLRIEYKSSACFDHSEETVVFYKENDQLFATNYSDNVALSSDAVSEIRSFETELSYPRVNLCTMYDTYRVFLNNEEVLNVEDNSCGWGGYNQYIASLFESEEEG